MSLDIWLLQGTLKKLSNWFPTQKLFAKRRNSALPIWSQRTTFRSKEKVRIMRSNFLFFIWRNLELKNHWIICNYFKVILEYYFLEQWEGIRPFWFLEIMEKRRFTSRNVLVDRDLIRTRCLIKLGKYRTLSRKSHHYSSGEPSAGQTHL